jgi:hypothetical protein
MRELVGDEGCNKDAWTTLRGRETYTEVIVAVKGHDDEDLVFESEGGDDLGDVAAASARNNDQSKQCQLTPRYFPSCFELDGKQGT